MHALFRPIVAVVLAGILARNASAFDCNDNGVDDVRDIASGVSLDCNENSVPDDCDIREANLEFSGRVVGELSCLGRLVVADLDADGRPDIASTCGDALLQFAWASEREYEIGWVPAQTAPRDVAVADFDGDDRVDLVAAGEGISLFRSVRRREWVETVLAETVVLAIAAGEFNGDEAVDFAVASDDSRLVFYYNEGGGEFSSESIVIGARPVDLVVVDLNADEELDIATGNAFQSVSVLLNEGETRFAEPVNYFSGPATQIVASDFDGDGHPDLAVSTGSQVAVLRNSGDGTFLERVVSPAATGVTRIVAGDADEDGDVDVLVPGGRRRPLVSFWNRGDGTFATPVEHRPIDGADSVAKIPVAAGERTRWLAFRGGGEILELTRGRQALSPDCNRTGIPDECELADNDCNQNGVPDECDLAAETSLDCDGNGVPDECDVDCDASGIPDACEIADGTLDDCNENGVPDPCDQAVAPTLGPPTRFAVGGELVFAEVAAFDDLDGDGRDDFVAVITETERRVHTWRSDGEGLEFADEFSLTVSASSSLATLEDFDGDRDLDVIVRSLRGPSVVEVVLNEGGLFETVLTMTGEEEGRFIASGDLDGDGDLDFLRVADPTTVRVDLSDGEKLVTTEFSHREPFSELVLADVNGDGALDMVLAPNRRVVRWFAGDGAGSFSAGLGRIDLDASSDELVVGNFHRGIGSEILARRASAAATIIGIADGRLAVLGSTPPISYGPLLAVDYDADGDDDILAAEFKWDSSTAVLRAYANDGGGRFVPRRATTFGSEDEPAGIAAGDIDADGRLDLVVGAQPICLLCDAADIAFLGFGSTLYQFMNRTEPAREVDINRNGILDSCEPGSFHRGDADADGRLAITDAIRVLLWLFADGDVPACRETADHNNDGRIALDDPVGLLQYLFADGDAPAHPGPPHLPCGADPDPEGSAADLGCEAYPAC